MPYQDLIFACQLIAAALGAYMIWSALRKRKKLLSGDRAHRNVKLHDIWILGLLSFLISLGALYAGMVGSFEAIESTGDISPASVASNIKWSIQQGAVGLLVLIASIISLLLLVRIRNQL